MGRHVLIKAFRASRMLVAVSLMAGCSSQDARSIVAEGRNVIADPETFPQISKIHTSAECTGPNGPFRTEIWSARDGSVRFEQRSSRGNTIAGIGDSASWILDDQEVGELDSPTEVFLRGHELHMIALYPESRLKNPVVSGPSEFWGRQATGIRFQDKLSNPVEVYYDSTGDYPLGMRVTNPFEEEAEEIQIVFRKWKRLDNGLFFFTEASFYQGDEVWTHEYSSIEIDGFDSVIFDPP